MRALRASAAAILVAIVVWPAASVAGASAIPTGVLDQSTGEHCCIAVGVTNHDTGAGFVRSAAAETFTAGLAGFLDTAELYIYQGQGLGGRYRVQLTGVAADGTPDEQPLATAVLDGCREGRLTSDPPSRVVFSPAPAILAGHQYALVVEYAPGTTGERAALWSGGAMDLPNGFPWAKDRTAMSPVWRSVWAGKPLSLFTYVSAVQPPALAGEPTTVTVSPTTTPIRRLEDVVFEARVAARPGRVPTGSVTFTVDGTVQPSVALDAAGTARQDARFTNSGPHTVTAAYCPAADLAFVSSEATSSFSVSDSRWRTRTALAAEPNPSVAWEPVTFEATVANAETGAPGLVGQVQFTEDDGTPIGPPMVLDGDGKAKLVAEAGAGTYTVRAHYFGDTLHDASTAALVQRIDRAATTTTLTGASGVIQAGRPVTIGVLVESEARSDGIPSGTVQLSADGAQIGVPERLDEDGVALLTVTPSAPGTPTIVVRYGGDEDYLPSEAQRVQPVLAPTVPAAPVATPRPVPRPASLTRADVLKALRIARTVPVPRRGAFALGALQSTRVRSVIADITARRGARKVLVAQARSTGTTVKARLTAAGRRLLAPGKRVTVQVALTVVDDTDHTLSVTLTRTLRRR
ncbi:Ig-like domain-containing protein [Solirubrobacter ginsenosidimutans]|uniref:Ig-like domain-containing protein n=1 Tax=Solirubrobacter ginsenosidimutans TaxID=490573 RepID=A0A9X3S0V9_9ACTN|nr:Ig-like domain-containing protein [Solirubrobacter ginsenosidimutans]MDA0159556.1 Ig-like domain-containing protein [Solirubrobacter ginsenosidimutans]